jgi:hypothetical protein
MGYFGSAGMLSVDAFDEVNHGAVAVFSRGQGALRSWECQRLEPFWLDCCQQLFDYLALTNHYYSLITKTPQR